MLQPEPNQNSLKKEAGLKTPPASLKINFNSKPIDQYDTDLPDDMGDEGKAMTPHNIGLMRNPGTREDQLKHQNSLRKLNL